MLKRNCLSYLIFNISGKEKGRRIFIVNNLIICIFIVDVPPHMGYISFKFCGYAMK